MKVLCVCLFVLLSALFVSADDQETFVLDLSGPERTELLLGALARAERADDPVLAYAYLRLAGSLGSRSAQVRARRLARQMSQDDLRRGEILAHKLVGALGIPEPEFQVRESKDDMDASDF